MRRGAEPCLYENDLADVSDLAEEIAQKHGDWFDFGKQANYVNGRWLGIPWGAWAFVSVYRPGLLQGRRGVDSDGLAGRPGVVAAARSSRAISCA